MPKITRRNFLRTAAGGSALALLEPSSLLAEEKPDTILPPPSAVSPGSLMAALKNRKSTRTFSGKPLPRQTVSDLLWAAFGVNRPESGRRTAPSAMNSQEVDIFAATADGLFVYDARFHQLVHQSPEDIRTICGTQKFVANAPLNLIFVADFSRMGEAAEDDKIFYSAAHVGFISQNVYLFCAAEGLATVVRGWVDRPALAEKMKLRKEHRIILAQTVGYPG